MPETPHIDSICEGYYHIEGLDTDAAVEGEASEMLALARAIRQRGAYVEARRCAVEYSAALECFRLWSPRNSQRDARLSVVEADALAAEITRYVVLEQWRNAGESEQTDVLLELGTYIETLTADIGREEVITDGGHEATLDAAIAARDLLEWARGGDV